MGELPIDLDSNIYPPTAFAKNASQSGYGAYLAGVLAVENENLTAAQKLLIHWHERFGHKSMTRLQKLFRSFPFFQKLSNLLVGSSTFHCVLTVSILKLVSNQQNDPFRNLILIPMARSTMVN